MEFSKYNSVENATHVKTLDQIELQFIDKTHWTLSEKIHGANFSVWCDKDDEVKFAKRSSFIGADEKFYSHGEVTEHLAEKAREIFEDIQKVFSITRERYGDPEVVTIYGELFGGSFDHPDVPKPKIKYIQKGIMYSPKTEFMAIDITINGQLVDDRTFEELCFTVGLFYNKPLFRGTLEECLEYKNEYDSTIPARLGYPHLSPNVCEGNVLKPCVPVFFGNDARVILKNKNEKWKEGASAKREKREFKLSDEQNEMVNLMIGFISENRLRNVISHIGTINQKDFGVLQKEFMLDVINQYTNDIGDLLDDKKSQNQVNKIVGKETANKIKKNFQNIVDGNF